MPTSFQAAKEAHRSDTGAAKLIARRRTARRPFASLLAGALGAVLALTAGGPAHAAAERDNPLASLLARNKPVICRNQEYALCAGARCFVFNDVAYCACDIEKGDSISSPFTYAKGNICSVNADGVSRGYMASTFSLPPALTAPIGKAIYKCPRTSRAAYAKCDGGLCFKSTIGTAVPGSNAPLGTNQIVCSCPVETANPIQGLEIIGPYPCQQSFFQLCNPAVANDETGTTLYDGTSLGGTETGTRLLYGSVPNLNVCLMTR